MKNRIFSILLSLLVVFTTNSSVEAQGTGNPKIDWLVEHNYVKGRSGGNLELHKNITRAEITTMLLAVKGEL